MSSDIWQILVGRYFTVTGICSFFSCYALTQCSIMATVVGLIFTISSTIMYQSDSSFSVLNWQIKEEYLSLGKPQRYKKMMQTRSGKLISDTVLQTLTRQERKQGMAGERYTAEKNFYEEAMNTVFSELMVSRISLYLIIYLIFCFCFERSIYFNVIVYNFYFNFKVKIRPHI